MVLQRLLTAEIFENEDYVFSNILIFIVCKIRKNCLPDLYQAKNSLICLYNHKMPIYMQFFQEKREKIENQIIRIGPHNKIICQQKRLLHPKLRNPFVKEESEFVRLRVRKKVNRCGEMDQACKMRKAQKKTALKAKKEKRKLIMLSDIFLQRMKFEKKR